MPSQRGKGLCWTFRPENFSGMGTGMGDSIVQVRACNKSSLAESALWLNPCCQRSNQSCKKAVTDAIGSNLSVQDSARTL